MQLRDLKPNTVVIHVASQKLYRIDHVGVDLDNIVSFVTAVDAEGTAITINRYQNPGDGTYHPRDFKRTSIRPEDLCKLNWHWRRFPWERDIL